jgi:hypothetical protein
MCSLGQQTAVKQMARRHSMQQQELALSVACNGMYLQSIAASKIFYEVIHGFGLELGSVHPFCF